MDSVRGLLATVEEAIPPSGFKRAVVLSVLLGGAFIAMVAVISPVGAYAQKLAVQSKLAKAAAKRRALRDAKRKAAVIDTSTVPPDVQERIINCTATALLAAMHDKSDPITAHAAMVTLCHRARKLGEALNTNAEEFFQEGLRAAAVADQRIAMGNARPLEGLPFSVKDCLHMTGAVATCGTAALAMKVADRDAVVVQALRDLGAIPFVRGNVPQSLMLPESVNAIWGRALNPWDTSRTPGGSSGGDAAIVAARAAPLAIGTDIGGSIRIPATFCGVVGFKPSAARLSHEGFAVPRKFGYNGQEGVLSTSGPLARCVEDCALFMRAATAPAAAALDPLTMRRPFDEAVYAEGKPPPASARPLRVGYFTTDDFFHACPTAQRAVREAVRALEQTQGVEVVPLTLRPGLLGELAVMYYAMMGADGGMREFKGGLHGEELHEMYSKLYFLSNLPGWLRPLLKAFLLATGEPRPAAILAVAHGKSTHEYWDFVGRRGRLKREFVQAVASAGLDAFLAPAFGVPALKHGFSADLNIAAEYTFVYNLMDLPAGTVPVTLVAKDEERYIALPGQDDRYAKKAKENAVGSAGSPFGVQVVGLPHADEVVLRVMSILESALPAHTADKRAFPAVPGVDDA